MFKTALNKNIIPRTWKLTNIVPIPKPNKDTDKGTSYRPISLLSVIAKTLEKSLLPYITATIPSTPMQHGYKTQHSTVTALHTLNNTVAKVFNQMAPPAWTITVALDMSKAFDTINIHILFRKLLQTKHFPHYKLQSHAETQHWELPTGLHTRHKTYNICMTKNTHTPHTRATYSSTPHNTNRKTQTSNHIPFTNHTTYFQHSKAQKTPLFLTTAATQQKHSHRPLTQSTTNRHKKQNMRHITHIYCPLGI